MALGTVSSGTQSATTDHLLDTGATTTPGVYTCNWNLTAMTDSCVVRCYVVTKTLTGDTAEVIYEGWYQHTNGGGEPLVSSPPVVSMFSIRCGVEEVGANTISIPWSLVRHAEY
jgi:hypothetical protein